MKLGFWGGAVSGGLLSAFGLAALSLSQPLAGGDGGSAGGGSAAGGPGAIAAEAPRPERAEPAQAPTETVPRMPHDRQQPGALAQPDAQSGAGQKPLRDAAAPSSRMAAPLPLPESPGTPTVAVPDTGTPAPQREQTTPVGTDAPSDAGAILAAQTAAPETSVPQIESRHGLEPEPVGTPEISVPQIDSMAPRADTSSAPVALSEDMALLGAAPRSPEVAGHGRLASDSPVVTSPQARAPAAPKGERQLDISTQTAEPVKQSSTAGPGPEAMAAAPSTAAAPAAEADEGAVLSSLAAETGIASVNAPAAPPKEQRPATAPELTSAAPASPGQDPSLSAAPVAPGPDESTAPQARQGLETRASKPDAPETAPVGETLAAARPETPIDPTLPDARADLEGDSAPRAPEQDAPLTPVDQGTQIPRAEAAPDGRPVRRLPLQAVTRYAAIYEPADSARLLGVVLLDDGALPTDELRRALAEFAVVVTVAIRPDSPEAEARMMAVRLAGHEVAVRAAPGVAPSGAALRELFDTLPVAMGLLAEAPGRDLRRWRYTRAWLAADERALILPGAQTNRGALVAGAVPRDPLATTPEALAAVLESAAARAQAGTSDVVQLPLTEITFEALARWSAIAPRGEVPVALAPVSAVLLPMQEAQR